MDNQSSKTDPMALKVLLPKPIINPAICDVEQQQMDAKDNCECSSILLKSFTLALTKEAYDNLSPQEKLLRRKLRNRDSARLSRERKKTQLKMLSEMVHTLKKENKHLMKEIESLRFNQESLIEDNERLKKQLAAELCITKPEFNKPVAKDRILIEGPAVSNRHPLQKGKRNQTFCLMLCYQILILLLTIPFLVISNFKKMIMIWSGLTIKHQNVWEILLMNYLVKVFSMNAVLMKWWGAHQKSWNPAKILMIY